MYITVSLLHRVRMSNTIKRKAQVAEHYLYPRHEKIDFSVWCTCVLRAKNIIYYVLKAANTSWTQVEEWRHRRHHKPRDNQSYFDEPQTK